ncbi:MAG: hypothetical protein E7215_00400 [Clostridium sulfidigenes]|uniref:Oligosaccharide repeat unit polymerase n=1 Tax=Clostridium sulfidigenes TaxID=318464 RepID=A0A927W4X8_9CLOT|nr:hypothetical protein [Clostridium sulfidigenes]
MNLKKKHAFLGIILIISCITYISVFVNKELVGYTIVGILLLSIINMISKISKANTLNSLSFNFIFFIVYSVYFFIGSIPILNYEKTQSFTIILICLGIGSYFIGTLFTNKVKQERNFKNRLYNYKYVDLAMKVFFTIGMIAIIFLILRNGILITNPVARGMVNKKINFLTNFFWMSGSYLFMKSMKANKKITFRNTMMIASVILLESTLGYRTPVLIVAVVFLFSYDQYVSKIKVKTVFILSIIILGMLSLYAYIRLKLEMGNGVYIYSSQSGIEEKWTWILPLIFITRTGTEVLTKLQGILAIESFLHGKLFMSIFSVLLPGEQDSSRMIVTRLLGTRLESSTTMTLIGQFYMDFNVLGIIMGMIIIGYTSNRIYNSVKIYRKNGMEVPLILMYRYSIWTAIVISSIHTGLVDFILIFIVLINEILVIISTKKNRYI